MPLGKRLNKYEMGLIDGYKAVGMSQREIARSIGRSPSVVTNYMRLKEDYGKKNCGGRPSILSNTAKRHIIRECSNKITTAKTIKANLDLNCSTRTVQRVISSSPLIERKTLKRKPALKQIP